MPQFPHQYIELGLVYFVTHKVVCDLFTNRLEVSKREQTAYRELHILFCVISSSPFPLEPLW